MLKFVLVIVDLCIANCLMAEQCDLSFGHRQVEQLICDRPVMGEIIKRDSSLRKFIELKFAGEPKGGRIYWDCREPTSGRPAEHLMAYSDYPALIRVSNKHKGSATDQCAMLVFELNNLSLDKEFQLLAKTSVKNRKSRDEFATSCIQAEFDAAKKAQLFFKEHPLSGATDQNSPYYGELIALRPEFSEYLRWLDSSDGKEYNPREYFRQAYDELISNSVHQNTPNSEPRIP